MSAFRVTRMVPVVSFKEEVLLETDDYIEAFLLADDLRSAAAKAPVMEAHVEGRDPSHEWAHGACDTCGAYDNGSFKACMPCGFDFGTKPFAVHVDNWVRERALEQAP